MKHKQFREHGCQTSCFFSSQRSEKKKYFFSLLGSHNSHQGSDIF